MSTSIIDLFDEPTTDWTVEQLLEWCLLRSHAQTDEKRDELINALHKQLEEGKAELWEAHDQAAATSIVGNDTVGNDGDSSIPITSNQASLSPESTAAENSQRSRGTVGSTNCVQKPSVAATKKKGSVKTIHVSVIGGPYEGKTFNLKPRPRSPCYVGRSAGKKFRERGMSLQKDSEVSTTHGKFEVKSGKAFFVDTGSTNGTLHMEQELEVNSPLELHNDMEILIGATLVKISLEY
uniref:FHA domain-containing protein n=1 Tax=Odontella aurita TaxID=265563 RepID=A0A7S4JX86_9STRA|mmetsp:Transcript_56383/g.168759  ORF Transcript_56383/g.168759 Transcript_56383/m.168759 type:complete len:237 (+) Transcript_56383:259-969(+)